MNLTFVTNKISGRGGTETVLVKVLNNLAKNGNSIRLVLSNLTPNKEWLHNLDPSIKIVYPKNSDKFNRLLYFLRIFLTSAKNTNYVILSPNIIKLFAKLRNLTHKKCKLISWFHFSIANQHDYDPKNIIFAEDVYMDIEASEDIYGKSNFVYGDMIDINKYFIEPNILQTNMSYIVKDYDGILYSKYRNMFEEYGYIVKNINFIETTDSFKYNPFDYFNYEDDVTKFVSLVLDANKLYMSDSEALIKNAESLFLESILYYVMLELPHDEHRMSTVSKLIQLAKPRNKIKEEYRSDLQLLFRIVEKEENKDENIALQKFNSFLQCAKHLEKIIIDNVEKYLAIYSMPSISQICEKDSLKVEEMVEDRQILFVITYASLWYSIIFTYLYSSLFVTFVK